MLSSFSKQFQHTFFDSQTLYYDDLLNLREGQWLNDSCINFCYLYFENELFKNSKQEYCFMAPSTSFWIQTAETKEDIECAVESLELPSKKLIFIPVNNNQDPLQSGGSHWSLIVFDRNQQSYLLYDSHNGFNNSSAKLLIQKLHPFICPSASSSKPKMINKVTPQQQNGSDCGIYVICITEGIASHYEEKIGDDSWLQQYITNHVKTKRQQICNLILQVYQKDIKNQV